MEKDLLILRRKVQFIFFLKYSNIIKFFFYIKQLQTNNAKKVEKDCFIWMFGLIGYCICITCKDNNHGMDK